MLFAVTNGSAQGSLQILTLNDGKVKTIVENATYGRYLASGHLVYYRHGTLFAATMDAEQLVVTGPPVPLVDEVSSTGNWRRAEFDLSLSGTLVYRGGFAGNSFVLSWLDSAGKTEPVISKPGHYGSPRLSPDGSRLALSMLREGKQNLWVYDLRRETWNRLTSDAEPVLLPTWTPDGEFVAFRSGNALAWKRSDGTGKLEYLTGVSPNAGPSSFSADGNWLAFWPLEDGSDLWIVPVERTPALLRMGQPRPLLQDPGSKGAPRISPDGRWVAYSSNESGRFEIYVMPFSSERRAVDRKWLVSNGGGTGPIWSRNGRELFLSDPRPPDWRGCIHGERRFVCGRKGPALVREPTAGYRLFQLFRRCPGREAGGGDAPCRGFQGRDAGAADAQRGCRTESPCAGVPLIRTIASPDLKV